MKVKTQQITVQYTRDSGARLTYWIQILISRLEKVVILERYLVFLYLNCLAYNT